MLHTRAFSREIAHTGNRQFRSHVRLLFVLNSEQYS